MIVPPVDLVSLPGVVVRPLVVAIAHLPILIVAFCAIPVWTMAVIRPATHGELAFRLLKELRTWSRDVIGAVHGAQRR
ncbi:hypothetical protein Aple_025430 [Acrocarpospora pleiomorpha]|uniref:Uncharacterized protein n=1 Tax=Acrocarpospora pleiomorpha TaxID=90975 RepID=A0A5M3XDG6_9ACTN|nr:hypothetical protein [Acrocarpospora pleiomorpha]GES19647.1 hypothetical protein Aple_025430 [Acrocarpospora pleiomorpha]